MTNIDTLWEKINNRLMANIENSESNALDYATRAEEAYEKIKLVDSSGLESLESEVASLKSTAVVQSDVSIASSPNTIVRRNSDESIAIGDSVAATKKQLEEAIQNFTLASDVSTAQTPRSIARRDDGGRLQVAEPIANSHAASKSYVDTLVDKMPTKQYLETRLTTRAPQNHSHTMSSIEGLVGALNAKLEGTLSQAPTANTIALRTNEGTVRTNEPQDKYDATTKTYVDGLVEEIRGTLAGKASATHTHTAGEVTLQSGANLETTIASINSSISTINSTLGTKASESSVTSLSGRVSTLETAPVKKHSHSVEDIPSLNGLSFKVIDTLPSSPDANTIYFIKDQS